MKSVSLKGALIRSLLNSLGPETLVHISKPRPSIKTHTKLIPKCGVEWGLQNPWWVKRDPRQVTSDP
jgi:hypothetical protein